MKIEPIFNLSCRKEMKAVKLVLSLLFLAVMALPMASALATVSSVAVSSFTLHPQKVLPGSEISIDLDLENVGDADIENILVIMDLSNVPFVPAGSSNEKIIEEIGDGSKERVTFKVRALPDAQPSAYKIPVIVSYEGASKISLISIEVTADAHLDLLLEKSELVKVNDRGRVTLKFVNDGLAQIKNLKVTLKESPLYQIISPDTLYVGEVSIGDFETEEFTIMPTVNDPILNLELEYRDAANNLFTESKLIKIPVYTEEEAKRLGLLAKSSSRAIPVAAAVLVLGAVLLYRRRKKKNAL